MTTLPRWLPFVFRNLPEPLTIQVSETLCKLIKAKRRGVGWLQGPRGCLKCVSMQRDA